MSAVLAVCGEAFCAMVGDGRMVEEPILNGKPKILTEDLPKVRKVNKNVVIGFAGDCLAAVQIINALEDYQTQYLTLEKIVKILAEKGKTVDIQPVGVRLLVGGRGRKGDFQLVTLGSAELQDMIENQHGAQVDCHFRNKRYKFSAEDLKLLLEAATIREDQ